MIELLLDAERALALGLVDQAERTYRSVLEADPRNGIAAVGLSRVALERGDEAGALALARAALDIDPDNATAHRMIDRLEEVARFRVESIAPPATAVERAGLVDVEPPGLAVPASPPPSATAPAAPAASSDATTLPARPGLLRRIFRRS